MEWKQPRVGRGCLFTLEISPTSSVSCGFMTREQTNKRLRRYRLSCLQADGERRMVMSGVRREQPLLLQRGLNTR